MTKTEALRIAMEEVTHAGGRWYMMWDRYIEGWRQYQCTGTREAVYAVRDARAVRAVSLLTGLTENEVKARAIFYLYPEKGSLRDVVNAIIESGRV